VNFGVYVTGLGTQSLAQTYLLAIPFDLKLMASTLLFSSIFYGSRYLIKESSYFGNRELS